MQKDAANSGAVSVKSVAEDRGGATADAADTAIAAAVSAETSGEPTSEPNNDVGSDENFVPESAEETKQGQSYADDFGEDSRCEGDGAEPGHDGPRNKTRPDPALVSADPGLEVSDLGDDANPVSTALSRPGVKPKTTEQRSPALVGIEVDDGTPVKQTREIGQRPRGGDFDGFSPGTTVEAPRVLDETSDDESSGYSADGAFGEEADLGAASVIDELEVPEFPLKEVATDGDELLRQDDSLLGPGSVVVAVEAIGEEASSSSIEGYMSDFDDAAVENIEDNTEAVVASKAVERDAQPASVEERAAAVRAEEGSQAGSSIATEGEGVLGSTSAHTDESISTEEYPSDTDDSSAADFEESVESADVDASSAATATAAATNANSDPESRESQLKSKTTVLGNNAKSDQALGGTTPVGGGDSSALNNKENVDSDKLWEGGGPESARGQENPAHSVPEIRSAGREKEKSAEGQAFHAHPADSTTPSEGSASAVNEGSEIVTKEAGGQSPRAVVTEPITLAHLPNQQEGQAGSTPIREEADMGVRLGRGEPVRAASEGAADKLRLECRKSSAKDFEQDFEDDFEEDVPSKPPQERQEDHGVDREVDVDKKHSVVARDGDEGNGASGQASVRGEGVNGNMDEKLPPQFATDKTERPEADEVRRV